MNNFNSQNKYKSIIYVDIEVHVVMQMKIKMRIGSIKGLSLPEMSVCWIAYKSIFKISHICKALVAHKNSNKADHISWQWDN